MGPAKTAEQANDNAGALGWLMTDDQPQALSLFVLHFMCSDRRS